MARHLFAILDELTATLAELKAALAPLALIGGTVVSEVGRAAVAPRRAKKHSRDPGRGRIRLILNSRSSMPLFLERIEKRDRHGAVAESKRTFCRKVSQT